jgi:broad specificity phosphatase PhoE
MHLVRHGATEVNLARPPRLQGRRNDPPLAEAGRAQAAAAAEVLAREPLAAIYASPLRRAAETAAAIAAPHGLPVEPLAAVVECDVGRWEGLTWDEVRAQDAAAVERFLADPAANRYAGGESHADVLARALPAVQSLLAEHEGQSVAVVTHHIVIRCLVAHVLGLPLAEARAIKQSPGGITILRWRSGELSLVTLNAAWHLAEWE